MKFSEKYGYKSVREVIQNESMDDELRNALWTALCLFCWNNVIISSDGSFSGVEKKLHAAIGVNYFKKPIDSLHRNWTRAREELRSYFFGAKWYEVYDFVEFVAQNYRRYSFNPAFTSMCNISLEREMSAYRFVGNCISRITEEHEIAAIEGALENSRGPVKTHIHEALILLSDRKSPNFRNSIKESISAVESLVKVVLEDDKGSFGKLIAKIENEIGLHPALALSMKKLYGYTSDEDGIRHALVDTDNTGHAEAMYALVVCSAFINFVESRLLAKQ